MSNQPCNSSQSVQHAKTNGHHVGNNHNGGVCSNGYNGVEQIASAEMCFYCFEVLHRELYRNDDVPEANFTNDA